MDCGKCCMAVVGQLTLSLQRVPTSRETAKSDSYKQEEKV